MIAAWWRKNRAGAPRLFDDELVDLIEKLKLQPFLGKEFESADGEMIRKARMRKSEQNVYYSVDERSGVIYIHTVWGARRGREPKF